MRKAGPGDKTLVVDILSKSFDSNKSVNFIVKNDHKRSGRIAKLMDYSFEVCNQFGEVFISDNNQSCALTLYPDRKKTTLRSILLDLKLILSCIGIENIKKALSRESKIKRIQPKEDMCYLWFIGVDPQSQHQGYGTKLLKEVIAHSEQMKRPVYLETSTLENLPWYQKLGFKVYAELDLGYKLYFLKRGLQPEQN